MASIITGIVILSLALLSGVISLLQFLERGVLFNNAYLWASKEERKRMNKKPH